MDYSQSAAASSQAAAFIHWGYVVGAIIFALSLVTLVRRRRPRDWVWAGAALVMIIVPLVVYFWAVLYLLIRGLGRVAEKHGRDRSPCGDSRCSNGIIHYAGPEGRTSPCRVPGFHGNPPA